MIERIEKSANNLGEPIGLFKVHHVTGPGERHATNIGDRRGECVDDVVNLGKITRADDHERRRTNQARATAGRWIGNAFEVAVAHQPEPIPRPGENPLP